MIQIFICRKGVV